MPDRPFSTELQNFVARHIRSVEQLEILCLLVENSAVTWTESDVFQRIQSSQESVSRTLQRFSQDGLLVFEPSKGYRFPLDNPHRLASDLVKVYRERRVTVISAIYEAPIDPIRDFADAFRIRKDKL